MERLPRFTRSPSPAPIRLTERDREIILQVHKHRFLRSTHILALMSGSAQQVLRRLQVLFHHGYLDRPTTQIVYYERGSRPMVYGLGGKGVALLKRENAMPSHQEEWSDRNRSTTRLFLEHALLISDVMVSLEIGCRKSGHLRLLTGREVPLPEKIQSKQPFKWHVVLKGNARLGVIPDRAFVVESHEDSGRRDRVLYFLEADCGTMPATRGTLAQSSFHRKLLAYETTWAQQVHRRRFGYDRFRVVTITTSPARVKTLVETCQRLERGRGLFLFADHASLRQHDIFSLPFQTAHSSSTELLLAN